VVVGGLVTGGQVFAVRQLDAAFKKSGDATLHSTSRSSSTQQWARFPADSAFLVVARFVLTTLGSAVVVVLLALPPAGDYFSG
jgi:hypothetical protein